MAATPIRQSDEVKLSEIITQINPDYRPAHIFRLKQWLFSFCSCFQPHEVDMERLCQAEDFLLASPPSPGQKTLVLDLDETLVHSVFSQGGESDFSIPVDIGGKVVTIFVKVRPGVDRFLTRMALSYEVVVYTASLAKYADPLLDRIDPRGHISHRLFRESCTIHRGSYIKDLSRLGRDLKNAIPISSWYDDMNDRELEGLIPVLEELANCDDVRVSISRAMSATRIPQPVPTPPSECAPAEDLNNSSSPSEPGVDADRSFSLPKKEIRRRSLNVNRGEFNSPLHSDGKHFEWSLSDNAKL